jgi:hypothetical protein
MSYLPTFGGFENTRKVSIVERPSGLIIPITAKIVPKGKAPLF